jgi:hypothetical protein
LNPIPKEGGTPSLPRQPKGRLRALLEAALFAAPEHPPARCLGPALGRSAEYLPTRRSADAYESANTLGGSVDDPSHRYGELVNRAVGERFLYLLDCLVESLIRRALCSVSRFAQRTACGSAKVPDYCNRRA